MFPESELLPISALQHLVFCERQWALIHLEGVWEENPLTMEGHHLHERTDASETEVRGDVRIARGLRLRSLRLGLVGRADVVKFYRLSASGEPSTPDQKPPGARLKGVPGLWRPQAVEYKRGKPKADHSDEVQLCAQTLCLEEMLNVEIPSGALFYGRTRRHHDVLFDDALRHRNGSAYNAAARALSGGKNSTGQIREKVQKLFAPIDLSTQNHRCSAKRPEISVQRL